MSNVIYLDEWGATSEYPWRKAGNRNQAESLGRLTVYGDRWEVWEDAYLHHTASNIAASVALGRTYYAVKNRRGRLRADGVL